MNNSIKLDNIFLTFFEDNVTNRNFIRQLFSVKDVRFFYVLRNDHSQNLMSFCSFLEEQNENQRAINFIIEDLFHTPMGIITAEVFQENNIGICWNVAYAMLPQYRRHGYVKEALMALSRIFQQFSIDHITLDISEENEASKKLARNCGYEPLHSNMGGLVGFLDPEHMELGMRLRWVKNIRIQSERMKLGMQAIDAYKNKDYRLCISLYERALQLDCPAGCSFEDGVIYANMAMAYSGLRDYETDYYYLKKAYDMGVRNPSVLKELKWLKDNVGLG